MNTPLPSLSQLQKIVYRALKLYSQNSSDEIPFSELFVFQQKQQDKAASARQASNQFLYSLLEVMQKSYRKDAELLGRRFLDEETTREIAWSLNVSEATVNRQQKQAIQILARILQRQEMEARDRRRDELTGRLEKQTYRQLIGVEDYLDKLVSLLVLPEEPWIISIAGMGGVGKTSLADAIARQIIQQDLFYNIGWVSARQQIFTLRGKNTPVAPAALKQEDLIDRLLQQLIPNLPLSLSVKERQRALYSRLKQNPHFIVVDNLETVPDVEELIPALHRLSNPGKFLLTSRHNLHYEAGVYHFNLPELSQSSALELMRYEIKTRNLFHLQAVNDKILDGIYQTVGGNPLAIKLVLGQSRIYPLGSILNDLSAAANQSAEALYAYIYRRAWEALDEPARNLFLAMLLVIDEGEPLEALTAITGLDYAVVHDSLRRLIDLNLVNSGGDYQERYYSIHNLTRTFLQKQALKWMS